MQLRLEPRSLTHPDAEKLISEIQQEYLARYGQADHTPVSAEQFSPPRGRFLVGYLGNDPVACGGWRSGEELGGELRDTDAEMKRLYVAAGARGRGFARTIVRVLERTAREAGKHRMVLETGTEQPEAVELYTSVGYAGIPTYGVHKWDPASVCLAKPLLDTARDTDTR
ncbi:Acetyltransferase (GNAT) family protein [Haloechinothrix alba]|uniref:Acetyltransferase (GNAT) family protein n=1 Tax=Haloechinothrix alba TaxID=664784 RepID=A0A238VN74_9PSEU|nr:GNAT family N-acetyltransferase [Haloechinothrix alba]SNR35597.1 Acetyltransferase (GNAT) family protein [Haloechinothrix alba]